MRQTYSAGGVVLNTAGQVAIVSQANGVWSLPKGHIEPGEDALAAAHREIYEETGLRELTYIKKLGTYSRFKLDKHNHDDRNEKKTMTFFLFRTPQHILCPQDPKHAEARWLDPAEIVDFLTHEKDQLFFQSIMADL